MYMCSYLIGIVQHYINDIWCEVSALDVVHVLF